MNDIPIPLKNDPSAGPEKAKKGPRDPGDALITIVQAGKLLEIGGSRVRQLINENWILKFSKGKMPLGEATRGYVRFLRDEARRGTRVAADKGLKDARQREIEMRIGEREHRLVDVEELEAIADELCGVYNAFLSGLPAQMTRDRELRARLEHEIDVVRRKIADWLETAAGDLKAGGSASPTLAEADA